MKQALRLLAVTVMAMLTSSLAWALDPLDVMEITPAEGTITSLQSFTITFGDLTVVVNEDAIPTLQKGGGATYDGGMMADDEGTTVFVDFEERLTEAGQYTLNIPDGAIEVDGVPLYGLSFRYTIQGSGGSFYDQITIDPAEGEVTSLQNFTITFPAYVGEIEYGSKAKLTNTTTGATYQAEMIDVGYSVMVNFANEITEPGNYELDIPGGTIVIYTLDGQMLPLKFRYTIKGGGFYDQITIDPAEGEVESLQNFTITFPAYVGEIEYGSKAMLTNTTTGATYQAEMIDVGYNVLVNFANEITEAGDYTLTIPAGAVVIYTLGEQVKELNFNYSIAGGSEPSFYDQITIDPAEGEVTSLQNFTITFPAYVGEIEYGSKAMLTNTTTGNSWQAELVDVGYNVLVNFANEITEPGNYTLTIPAGAVVIYTLGEQVKELNFNYSIASGSQEADFTVNPAEGEVYLLQNFTLAFGSMVQVNEDATATLVNDETGASYTCNLLEIGGNAMFYMMEPLDVLGSYTLTIPAGCIEVLATGQRNAQIVLHYTIVEKETFVPTVIENQPDGELRIYQRSGSVVREVEKEDFDEEDPYELVYEQQEGTVSVVYGADNKVYIQHPVSTSYYDGWVEGTLSADGKTITVPMGQYIAYTRSLEMAVQVAVFSYDEYEDTYTYDESVSELTFTIGDDGTLTLGGTDREHVLGTMNRVFGDVFKYLDYEWLQGGDYESVFTPIDETPLTPPADLITETYYLTTANFNGIEWEPYQATVNIGFDGDDMWLQGISKFLPEAWIKGTCSGNTVTFANPQLLGSYETLLYFKSAEVVPATGETTQKDLVLTYDGEGTYSTIDYVYITTDKANLTYVNYYQGLTLSKLPDQVVEVPGDLTVEEYEFSYTTRIEGDLVDSSHRVNVGFAGDKVYIQGLWPTLPEAWVCAQLTRGSMVMSMPQYLGDYVEEYSGTYPIYLTAFDPMTGILQPQVTMDYDPATRVFGGLSLPLSIGINKTGYLGLQDYENATFTPINPFSGVIDTLGESDQPVKYYDLQGRELTDPTSATGVVIVKHADGTATKILKR